MRRGYSVNQFLEQLDDKPFQAYLSDAVQITDLLQWVLDQVGESYVIQTSFSISEEYLRRIHRIRDKGLVNRLDLILDAKAANKTMNLWYFISNVADRTFFANNHSKILLVNSVSGRRVAVVTSQNLTRGNRNESTFIAESDDIYFTLYNQVQSLIDNSISINEILGRSALSD